jgi:Domain of unknown function (DUF2341)/Secretion system C-terminal sorting domain
MKKIYKCLLLVLLFNPAIYAQLPSWQYRQTITVTENSATTLTDYQLKLVVNTQALISAGFMNADGSDIRFTKTCSTSPVLYNYWIDTGLNTPNTVIWVKVDTLIASQSKTIFMYYGNVAASAVSAINGTFIGPHSSTDSVASGGAGGATNSQRGFRFSSNQDLLVTHFGKREPNGTTRYITLFDFATQAKLRQIQVNGPAAQYSYGQLPNPIWLTQGTQYLLEMYQGASDGYYFGTSSQIGQHLTYGDMRYCNSCTENTFPTNILTNFHYGYPDLWYFTKNTASVLPTYTLSSHGLSAVGSLTISTTATAVCKNDTVLLVGSGLSTYLWSNGSTNDSITVNPSATATFGLTGTDANGCSAAISIAITVNPLPSVMATFSNDTICAGDSTLLSATGALSYTWNNSAPNGFNFVPTISGNYVVTGTDINGCKNKDTVALVINALSNVTASATNDTLCVGQSTILSGSGAATYVWNNSVLNGTSFVPTLSGNYIVTGTDINGCNNKDTVVLVINALPNVTASAAADTLCSGQSTILNGGGAVTYVWDNGVSNGVSFVPSATVTYSVIGTDANACSNKDSITVTVNANPIVNLGGNQSSCNPNIILNAGNPGSTYAWSNGATTQTITVSTNGTYSVQVTNVNTCSKTDSATITLNSVLVANLTPNVNSVCEGSPAITLLGTPAGGTFSSNAIGGSFNPTTAGTFTASYIVSNVCGIDTADATIAVNANPVASLTAPFVSLCAGTPATLTGLPVSGTYSVVSGSPSALVGNVFNASNVGSFTIAYSTTNAANCTDTAQFTFNVNCVLGLDNTIINHSSLTIFPNPNNGVFTISSSVEVDGTIELINELGQVVYKNRMNGLSKNMDVQNIAAGIYHLRMTNGTTTQMKRLSIVK